jgi:hypothetical protein
MKQPDGRAGRGTPPVSGHREVSRWGRLCLVAVASVLLAVLPGLVSPAAAVSDPGPGTSQSGAGQRISGDHIAIMVLRGPRAVPGRAWLDRAGPDTHPTAWHPPAILISEPPEPARTMAAAGSVVAWHAPGIGTMAARSGCCRAPPRQSVDSTS